MSELVTGLNFEKVFRHLLQISSRLAYYYHRQSQSDVEFEKLSLDFDKLFIDFNDREKNMMNFIIGMIEKFFQNNRDYIQYQKHVYRRQIKYYKSSQYVLFLKFEIRVIETFLRFCPEKQSDVYLLLKCVINCLLFSSIFLMTLQDHVEDETVLFDKVCEILFKKFHFYSVPQMLQLKNELGKDADGKIDIIQQQSYLLNVTIFPFDSSKFHTVSSFNFEKVFRYLLRIVSRLASQSSNTFDLENLSVEYNIRERNAIVSIRRIVERFFREDIYFVQDHEQSYLNYQYNSESDLFQIFDRKVYEAFDDIIQFSRLKYTVDPLREISPESDIHAYHVCFINLLILSGILLTLLLKKDDCEEKCLVDRIYNTCFKFRHDVPKYIRDSCLTSNPFEGHIIIRDKGLSVKLVKEKQP